MFNSRNWFNLMLIASIAGIVTVTLSPFNFFLPDSLSLSGVIQKFHYSSNIKDYVRNILLFIPLGISLAGILETYKHKFWQIVLSGLICGLVLSSMIELSQVALNSRVSSISDIVCNSLGSMLGTSLYIARQDFNNLFKASVKNNFTQVNSRFLLIILISYCLTLFLGARLLKNDLNLSNWNENYYLAIGSEVDGLATWNGFLTNLEICDRALTPEEVSNAWYQGQLSCDSSSNSVAAYTFNHLKTSYQDEKGQSPELIWRNNTFPPKDQREPINSQQNILFKYPHSLISQTAARNINQKIKQSGEFSLSLKAATNHLKQVGPARIISLAGGLESRNLQVGQTGRDLVLFLRTAITGSHASQPSFLIPNFFANYKLHHLLITYNKDEITFYVDQVKNKYTFKFQLATSVRLYLPWTSPYPGWRIDVTQANLYQSNLIFFGFAFFPVTILIRIFLGQLLNRNYPSNLSD